MRKLSMLLVLLALVGMANADNLLKNSDFEYPTGTGWTQWWTPGNSMAYVKDPMQPDHCASVWCSDDGIEQGVAIETGTYEFGGAILALTGQDALVSRLAVIKAEIGKWDSEKEKFDILWVQQVSISASTGQWDSEPKGDAVIDNTAAGANYVKINLMLIDDGDKNPEMEPFGIAYFDDVYLRKAEPKKEAAPAPAPVEPKPADPNSVKPVPAEPKPADPNEAETE